MEVDKTAWRMRWGKNRKRDTENSEADRRERSNPGVKYQGNWQSIRGSRLGKVWTKMCPLAVVRGSPLVILEKVVSEIWWDRNQREVN